MASGRPTPNTLIKSLGSGQCDSLDAAITLLQPADPADTVRGPWDLTKRNSIVRRFLDFPAPTDANVIKRLGRAMTSSGVVSGFIDDWNTGLIPLTIMAMEEKRQDWMDVLTQHAMATLWTISHTASRQMNEWVRQPDTTQQMRWRIGQHLAKSIRRKSNIHGSQQARNALILLTSLMEVAEEGQNPLSANDRIHVERLIQQAPGTSHGEMLERYLRKEALESQVRWVPERDTPKTPKM